METKQDLVTFGEQVRRMRLTRGLTQKQLGDMLGYGKGAAATVCFIEKGRRLPNKEKISMIKDLFPGIDIGDSTREQRYGVALEQALLEAGNDIKERVRLKMLYLDLVSQKD
jgi:transcriptional regulator with XRE-family HTH domain